MLLRPNPRAGERSGRSAAKLRGVAADEPGGRSQIARQALLDRAAHDRQCATQYVANLGDGPSLILGFRLERDLRERDPARLGSAHSISERVKHGYGLWDIRSGSRPQRAHAATLSSRYAQRTQGSARM